MGQSRIKYTDNNHTTSGYCEDADKRSYTNKHEARNALVGQMKSKAMRVYQCQYSPGHWHITSQYKN